MTRLAFALAAAALANAAPAAAQTFDGAELGLTYQAQQDFGYHNVLIDGSVQISWGGLSLQVDRVVNGYSDGTGFGNENFWTIHLFTEVAPGIDVGAFYTHELWSGDLYSTLGLEAAGDIAGTPISFDAFIAAYDYDNFSGSEASTIIAGTMGYDFGDGLTLTGGITLMSGYYEIEALQAGVAYEVGDFELTASVLYGNFDGSTQPAIEIGARYAFGSGTTMGRRTWFDLYPGY